MRKSLPVWYVVNARLHPIAVSHSGSSREASTDAFGDVGLRGSGMLRLYQTEERGSVEGKCIWITGLPGSGKSTLARLVGVELERRGEAVSYLDGDVVRASLSADLGFGRKDRDENVVRVATAAAALVADGQVVIVSLVSPYREARQRARDVVGAVGEFIEVHADSPLATCVARDPKGLYARALAGTLAGVTGIDDPYEPPKLCELVVLTDGPSEDQSAAMVLAYLD